MTKTIKMHEINNKTAIIDAVKNTIFPGYIETLKKFGKQNIASILKFASTTPEGELIDNVKFNSDNLTIFLKVANDMNVIEIKQEAPDIAKMIQTALIPLVYNHRPENNMRVFDVTLTMYNNQAKKIYTWTTSKYDHSAHCLMTRTQKDHLTVQAEKNKIQISDYLRKLVELDIEVQQMKGLEKQMKTQTIIPSTEMDHEFIETLEHTYKILGSSHYDINMMRNMVDMRFADNTQTAIAEALGTNQPTVSKYLKTFKHTFNKVKAKRQKTA